MIKKDIVSAVNQHIAFPTEHFAVEIMDTMLEVIKETLAKGVSIKIAGFGNFDILEKGQRLARNPRTGAVAVISARKVVTFRPSRLLVDKINPGRRNHRQSSVQVGVENALLHDTESYMKPEKSSLQGCWKIVWMKRWDQDFVDAEVSGHVTLSDKGDGDFQFGYVCGSFRWSPKSNHIDSRWAGSDEMDDAQGNIHAIIEAGELRGSIEFSEGDKSAFRAVRTDERSA